MAKYLLGYKEESNLFAISSVHEGLPKKFIPVEMAKSMALLHIATCLCYDANCHNLDDVHEVLDRLPIKWPDIDPFTYEEW